MNATRKDLVRFVSDVRLELEGPDGALNDGGGRVKVETCERLVRKLKVRRKSDPERSPVDYPVFKEPAKAEHGPA